jgi:hypothetical protein
MSDRVFYCPGCRQQYAASRRPGRGELFDCPRCHLLFVPGDRDFDGGAAPHEPESPPAETTTEPVRDRHPRPPYSGPARRRKRKFRAPELIVPWITGAALVVIASVLYFVVSAKRPAPIASAPAIANTRPPPTPLADASGSENHLANASGSPKAEPFAPAPAPPVAHAPASPPRLEEATLLGEWESPETPLLGVVGGEVFSITFQARGVLTVQARTVLEIATLRGGWKLDGSTLTFRLGGQEVPVTAELKDADTLRLTVGGKLAEFKRKN